MSTQLPMSMETHPDILELRDRAERVVATPRAQAVEALAILAGLFLAASPWVVGYNTAFSTLAITNLIVGLAYTVLMAGFGSAYERTHARAWAASLLGIWTVVAPWAINGGAHVRRTILTNTITGGVMLCLGMAAVAMTVTLGSGMLRRRGSAPSGG
ncbi:SPW repeat protein [Kitasatospora sp. MAP5-34]|uniref:SPW repeat protein n=1 Tax=Kitasatospora sp. MAP5-34 TaxID=3035102 RepID=UPI0024745460|nr:SPW repeat protein [Kitasatospora sp. MAP5-34]